MGELRSGYAANILSEIMGLDVPAEAGSAFLDCATGGGVAADVVMVVGELMRRRGDVDDVLAAAMCAVLGHLWAGHASVYGRDLRQIFANWCAVCGSLVEAFGIAPGAMYDRLMRAEGYVCRDLAEADGALLYVDGRDVYATPRLARMSRQISGILCNWIVDDANIIDITKEEIEEKATYEDKGRICKPHEGQVDAVWAFCHRRLTVVAGGPGTGKTSMVVCQILRIAFENCGLKPQDILLAAPTGKAAQRMIEAISQAAATMTDSNLKLYFEQLEAQTLHRLLSLKRGKMSPYACGEKLAAKLVIVDEVSMVELPLAKLLFEAIDPEVTRLVLVGDPNQLPPVGTGEILTNFVNDEDLSAYSGDERIFYENLRKCTKVLTKNFRAAGAPEIVGWQEGIIAGAPEAAEKPATKVDALRFEGAEYCTEVTQLNSVIGKWIETMKAQFEADEKKSLEKAANGLVWRYGKEMDLAELGSVFDFFDRGYRVLSSVNDGSYGVKRLNNRIKAALGLNPKYEFPCGSLVMLTENNYRINHFNGDTGIVVLRELDVNGEKYAPLVAFPVLTKSGERTFEFFALETVAPMLQLAFAITIHKSQGSEYAHGLIVLPPQESMLLSRNLLYTAVSRMRRSVVVLGTRETMQACIGPVRRYDPLLPYATQ